MANVTTKKQYGDRKDAPEKALPTKDVNYENRSGKNDGQMSGKGVPEDFAQSYNSNGPSFIGGIEGLHDDIGEKSGFITDGYIDKGDTPYGEAAKFNFLPPGMDISNQENAEIHEMKLYKVTEESYPGDGWSPKPRDLPE